MRQENYLEKELRIMKELEYYTGEKIPKRKIIHWNGIGYRTEYNSIVEINISRTNLKDLPNSIGGLKALKRLSLINNKLSSLPYTIGELKSIETLDFHKNLLVEIPDSIGKLTNLKELYLEYNRLKSLPCSLIKLNQLKNLSIRYNPFNEEREELVYKSIDELFQYLEEKRRHIFRANFIKRSKERDKELKVGPGGILFDLKR
ncbi:MAG: hypothetical protein GF329_04895 [Candidatus Lokiarchaeota archaeon]|nr:hypothetical protein [Candidatus Lokiarchaeota archaeon]